MIVTIEKLDNYGRGISYINNKICFVKNALPNEIVDIEIINEKKKYIEGRVLTYKAKSDKRINEKCIYSNICGGCSYNHISFDNENFYKELRTKDIISKYANISSNKVLSIIYDNEFNYRNKVTLHGSGHNLGLYMENTNEVVQIESCLLLDNKINNIITLLNNGKNNISKVIIKISNDTSQIMVSLDGEITNKNELLNICNVLIINGNCLTTSNKILTNIGNYKYYQSIDSFFQINKTLTEKLYDEVLNICKEYKPKRVLDLYCGVGTISIYISKYCGEIIGIDYNKSNIVDANENKKLNSINNVKFICDKVENKIDSFKDIDLIVVDPPRKGLDKKTIEYINKIAPQHLVYMSCDTITLSRDLKLLNKIYNIEYIRPYNMFPRAFHVECISVLERRNVEK